MTAISKKRFRDLALCAALMLGIAASGSRTAAAAERLVLMEKFSASWCPHCATASQAIAGLVEDHGDKFTTFDAFTATDGRYWTEWGRDRGFNFYGMQSYPTTVFDGVTGFAGAPSVDAVYNAYRDTIDSRSNVPTDVVIGVSAIPGDGSTYDVTTTVRIEPDGHAKTLRIHLIQALGNYSVYDDPSSTGAHNTLMQVVATDHDLTIAPGETRQLTDSFTLDAASASQFDDVRLIAWAQTPTEAISLLSEVHNATEVALSQSHPADYNHDGIVNRGDLTIWQNNVGTVGLAPYAGADGDGNGHIDGADLLLWQRSFGTSLRLSTAAVATAVPEPTTLLLLLSGVSFVVPKRRATESCLEL